MAASATFALKAGVWFRRGRLLMVSPDSWGTACPPSGRNSTYRPVQISGTGSLRLTVQFALYVAGGAFGYFICIMFLFLVVSIEASLRRTAETGGSPIKIEEAPQRR